MGSKQIGKSFLIDFLISKEEKLPSRLLTKQGKEYINMPSVEVRAKNNEKILYFDVNDEISNECFLWSYFLSSVMVLNLTSFNSNGRNMN